MPRDIKVGSVVRVKSSYGGSMNATVLSKVDDYTYVVKYDSGKEVAVKINRIVKEASE